MQPVYTLLCKRDLAMASLTIPKIIAALLPEQQLNVVDDGSFDSSSIEIINAISNGIKIITRAEREDIILKHLGDRNFCKKYRNEFPLAFKLIDIPLLAYEQASRFVFTDGDIIYLQNCTDYFNQTENTYLRTDAVKLSFKLKDGLLTYKWNIPYKFNSGYFSFDQSGFDLDFIEYFLGLSNVRNVPWLSEQSCWALLFGRSGVSFCPSENEFVCQEDFTGPRHDTKAIHLIGKLKSKVGDWSAYEGSATTTTAKFERSRNVTLTDWTVKSVKRILKVH